MAKWSGGGATAEADTWEATGEAVLSLAPNQGDPGVIVPAPAGPSAVGPGGGTVRGGEAPGGTRETAAHLGRTAPRLPRGCPCTDDDEIRYLVGLGGDSGAWFNIISLYETELEETIEGDTWDCVDMAVDRAALVAWLARNRPQLEAGVAAAPDEE